MKKIFIAVFCLLLAVPVLFTRPVVAATPAMMKNAVSPTLTPTPTPGPIEYVLPYPGILPTHPLYFIKTLRDRIIEMLITDPISKAEFYILQADKKLNMGVSLKRTGKAKEAVSAFTESLASRSQAVSILEEHRKSGKVIPGHLTEKLTLSIAKHAEVLKEAGEGQESVQALRERVSQMSLEDK